MSDSWKQRTKASRLKRPRAYWKGSPGPFRTYPAFRYHLDRRDRNGLVASGAVIEGPFGLLVDPLGMARWLLSQSGADPNEDQAA